MIAMALKLMTIMMKGNSKIATFQTKAMELEIEQNKQIQKVKLVPWIICIHQIDFARSGPGEIPKKRKNWTQV